MRKDGHFDQRLLAFVTLGLVAFGLVMVYSATSAAAAVGDGDPMSFLKRQAVYALIGVVVGMGVVGGFVEQIFHRLMQPVLDSLPEKQRALHYTSYVEPLMVYLKVALYGGIFAAVPHEDKTYKVIDGANHYYSGQREHLQSATDTIAEWLDGHGIGA